jgi:hypothetical protein
MARVKYSIKNFFEFRVENFNEISRIFAEFYEILTEFYDIMLEIFQSFCRKNFRQIPSKFHEISQKFG